MPGIFEELKRRNVFRVGIAYVVIAWVTAQVAELALDSFAAPDWVIKTLLLLLALGLPLALFFAWAFELTPEGLKKESEIDRSQSITPQTGRKLDRAIMGVLVVAIGLLVVDNYVLKDDKPAESLMKPDAAAPAAAPAAARVETEVDTSSAGTITDGRESIAVLPFVNMSGDAENEYFSDGISEEILNLLARIKGLRVASRTSAFSLKGKDLDIPAIAERLKVDHILEGSVRRSADKVRITAQLIEVKSDSHLWSDTYDRELKDIFAVQDEIAGRIAEAMQLALAPASLASAQAHDVDPEAYDLFLQGRYLWHKRGEENLRRAIALFERAVEIDPGFARAWAATAVAWSNMPAYSSMTVEEMLPRSQGAAKRALEIDPRQADAILVLADNMLFERRYGEAVETFERALEIEPENATGWLWYSEVVGRLGYWKRREEFLKKSLAIDPMYGPVLYNLAEVSLFVGDLASTRSYAQAAKDANFSSIRYINAWMALDEDDIAGAQKLMAGQLRAFGATAEEEAAIIAALGGGKARRAGVSALDSILQRMKNGEITTYQAQAVMDLYLLFDELDRAMALADALVLDGYSIFDMSFWGKRNKQVRQHPRFKEIVKKRGFVNYWRKHGWPDDCHPVGDADFECE